MLIGQIYISFGNTGMNEVIITVKYNTVWPTLFLSILVSSCSLSITACWLWLSYFHENICYYLWSLCAFTTFPVVKRFYHIGTQTNCQHILTFCNAIFETFLFAKVFSLPTLQSQFRMLMHSTCIILWYFGFYPMYHFSTSHYQPVYHV